MLEAKREASEARTDKDKQFFARYCDSLDNQIDRLVYRLYDIADEERKIIESS